MCKRPSSRTRSRLSRCAKARATSQPWCSSPQSPSMPSCAGVGTPGFKFLPVGIGAADLFDASYLPSILPPRDYPATQSPKARKCRPSRCRPSLPSTTGRKARGRLCRVSRLVDHLFTRLDQLRAPSFHPAWRDVNLAAGVPGLKRFTLRRGVARPQPGHCPAARARPSGCRCARERRRRSGLGHPYRRDGGAPPWPDGLPACRPGGDAGLLLRRLRAIPGSRLCVAPGGRAGTPLRNGPGQSGRPKDRKSPTGSLEPVLTDPCRSPMSGIPRHRCGCRLPPSLPWLRPSLAKRPRERRVRRSVCPASQECRARYFAVNQNATHAPPQTNRCLRQQATPAR